MSKTNEAIKLLKKSVRDSEVYGAFVFWGNPNFLIVSKYDFDQALKLLRHPKCKTCGDSKKVRKEIAKNLTDYIGDKIPCPDCTKKENIND